jgi:hypothetical protein
MDRETRPEDSLLGSVSPFDICPTWGRHPFNDGSSLSEYDAFGGQEVPTTGSRVHRGDLAAARTLADRRALARRAQLSPGSTRKPHGPLDWLVDQIASDEGDFWAAYERISI